MSDPTKSAAARAPAADIQAPSASWRSGLHAFFEGRGREVGGRPSLDDLCYIAGRDPRLWRDEGIRADLRDSLLHALDAGSTTRVLEVGAAAGFLASLVAPSVGGYVGVDLAEAPLRVARRLGLPRARFEAADGAHLPFPDASFDAAFLYDVVTNLPSIEEVAPLVSEMLRVVRPGGAVLVGSIPDRAAGPLIARRAAELSARLEAEHGPLAIRAPAEASPLMRWLERFGLARLLAPAPEPMAADPSIVCFEFSRAEFEALGPRLGADARLDEIHALNPYRGLRFNAVFRRRAA